MEKLLKDPILSEELRVISETGFYRSKEEFIKEGLKTLLAARKDLRESLASLLYKKEVVSLGKAAEIAGKNIEEMKKIFKEKGIKRNLPSLTKEKSMAAELLKLVK